MNEAQMIPPTPPPPPVAPAAPLLAVLTDPGSLLEMSLDFAEVAAAFAAAQAEFPELSPDSEGSIEGESKASGKEYRFSYDYASLGAVLHTYRPVLAKHGISIWQPAAFRQDAESNTVRVEVQTWLMHKSGQWIRTKRAQTTVPAGDMKKTGGAITYIRRYQVGPLLGVAPEEDTDADSGGRRKENVQRAPGAQAGGAGGRFQCRHRHAHATLAEARDCPGDGGALEPGNDPPAMEKKEEPHVEPLPEVAPSEDPYAPLRAALAAKEWRKALDVIETFGRNTPRRKEAEGIYSQARQQRTAR